MAVFPENSQAGLEAEEARLARSAAAGDGAAFATLYECYARRAYNLALRLCGSDQDAADAVQEAFLSVMRRLPELGEDRELAFGSYLFTATRNATYDLMRRQQRSQPSDSIPDSAVPLGAGAGGLGLDPGDPDEDPDRKVLLAAQQEEIAAASERLPERQREALALRELEEMSYDEIAVVMEMNRNSVAQLISRARINLRDELRGGALASVTVSSPECERALPLIAARDDGQLAADSTDAAWLASHMSSCHTCQVASEAMQEAGVSYRAWIPVAVAPWVFKETMAKAAELSGADGGEWRELAERRLEHPTEPDGLPGLPAAYRSGAGAEEEKEDGSRRRAALVGALAILLLLAGAVVAISSGGGEGPQPEPVRSEVVDATVEEPAPQPEPEPAPEKKAKKVAKKAKPEPDPTPTSSEAAAPEALPATESSAAETPPRTESRSTKAAPAAEPQGGAAGLDEPRSVGQPKAEPEPEPEAVPPPPPPVEEPTEPVPPTREPPRQPPAGVPGGPRP
jgi:RNA polymerase sigma-70 factor (ECF subfamily)